MKETICSTDREFTIKDAQRSRQVLVLEQLKARIQKALQKPKDSAHDRELRLYLDAVREYLKGLNLPRGDLVTCELTGEEMVLLNEINKGVGDAN